MPAVHVLSSLAVMQMRRGMVAGLLLLSGLPAALHAADKPAPAQDILPARNLLVGLRQVDLTPADAVVTSTRARQPALMNPQQILVGNGQSARFELSQGQLLQWGSTIAIAPGQMAMQSSNTWLTTGQSLSVQPSWRGGDAGVEVVVAIQASSTSPGTSTDRPRVQGQDVQTRLTLPLNQWTTIAMTGDNERAAGQAIVSTGPRARGLQIRVSPQ